MRPNISIKVRNEAEAIKEAERLKNFGYEKIADYPRFERWTKNNWIVEIKKGFRQR